MIASPRSQAICSTFLVIQTFLSLPILTFSSTLVNMAGRNYHGWWVGRNMLDATGRLRPKEVEVLDVRGRLPYSPSPSSDPNIALASNHFEFGDQTHFKFILKREGTILQSHNLPFDIIQKATGWYLKAPDLPRHLQELTVEFDSAAREWQVTGFAYCISMPNWKPSNSCTWLLVFMISVILKR